MHIIDDKDELLGLIREDRPLISKMLIMKFIGSELAKDKDVIKEAFSIWLNSGTTDYAHSLMPCVGPRLKNNKEFVLDLIDFCKYDESNKENGQLVAAIIRDIIRNLGDKIKDDQDIIRKAIRSVPVNYIKYYFSEDCLSRGIVVDDEIDKLLEERLQKDLIEKEKESFSNKKAIDSPKKLNKTY